MNRFFMNKIWIFSKTAKFDNNSRKKSSEQIDLSVKHVSLGQVQPIFFFRKRYPTYQIEFKKSEFPDVIVSPKNSYFWLFSKDLAPFC